MRNVSANTTKISNGIHEKRERVPGGGVIHTTKMKTSSTAEKTSKRLVRAFRYVLYVVCVISNYVLDADLRKMHLRHDSIRSHDFHAKGKHAGVACRPLFHIVAYRM